MQYCQIVIMINRELSAKWLLLSTCQNKNCIDKQWGPDNFQKIPLLEINYKVEEAIQGNIPHMQTTLNFEILNLKKTAPSADQNKETN